MLLVGLGVTALLALAGIASHGRPLARSHGGGPTLAFWEYLFTTVVIVAVAAFLITANLILKRVAPWASV